MHIPEEITLLSQEVIVTLTNLGRTVCTVESCTGGLIGGALTSISGSSSVVYGGFITYANEAKTAMVGVPNSLIMSKGAVSEEVARAMAEGGRKVGGTDYALAVTGVAGPTGGTEEKPVGLVHFGLATPNGVVHEAHRFGAIGRDEVRQATVRVALNMLIKAVQDEA